MTAMAMLEHSLTCNWLLEVVVMPVFGLAVTEQCALCTTENKAGMQEANRVDHGIPL